MIGEKFVYNDIEYTVKKNVSFGEYKRISKLSTVLQKTLSDYNLADDEKKIKLSEQFSNTIDQKLQMMSDFLESTLGLTQNDIDELSFNDASELFDLTLINSTHVKKKIEITLESPSSPTT